MDELTDKDKVKMEDLTKYGKLVEVSITDIFGY